MAYARSPAAHTIHKMLLKRNTQKPQFLLNFRLDETSHAATTVTSIAGHCNRLTHISQLKMPARFRTQNVAGVRRIWWTDSFRNRSETA